MLNRSRCWYMIHRYLEKCESFSMFVYLYAYNVRQQPYLCRRTMTFLRSCSQTISEYLLWTMVSFLRYYSPEKDSIWSLNRFLFALITIPVSPSDFAMATIIFSIWNEVTVDICLLRLIWKHEIQNTRGNQAIIFPLKFFVLNKIKKFFIFWYKQYCLFTLHVWIKEQKIIVKIWRYSNNESLS